MTTTYTATYSPDDNKLRLYSMARLDAEVFARVRAAGFAFAPKQDLFVAPAWSPEREDLLLELCGEIDDEDTSLVDRAEERASRFEDYGERRAADAGAAREAVARVADNIPPGQRILVGHHSEKHARRDAKRIENGMRRAIKLWETSTYWTQRAAGALRHAKHKETPGVRHRRMKGLEADKRKRERAVAESERFSAAWRREGLTRERALKIANFDHVSLPPSEGETFARSLWSALSDERIGPEGAAAFALELHAERIAHAKRWIAHLYNRLAYERAMLDEAGGVASERFAIEVGGRVLVGREWLVVLRVNRANGQIDSVTTNARFGRVKGIETVSDYRPPEADDVAKVAAATKRPPLVNYPGEGFQHLTRAEWDRKPNDFKATRIAKATEHRGAHRYRTAFVGGGSFATSTVYITDAKRVDPPAASAPEEPVTFERELEMGDPRPRRDAPAPTAFDAMREQLKAGIRVVQADQLFPTPPDLAARVVALADIGPEHTVLEPSAGTGALVREIEKTGANVVAVEINPSLAKLTGARCADFTACRDLGTFDRVVMNPPFGNGQDVDHVAHALTMLAPNGKLVAVISAGVSFRSDRKTTAFREMVKARGKIEDLPEGTFASSGTKVRAVLVTVGPA